MKRTAYKREMPPYTLHDMNITDFETGDDRIVIRTQSGMVKTKTPYSQANGYIELNGVDWDFSYAYVFEKFYGNIDNFKGKRCS